MDWALAVEQNRGRLLAIVIALLVSLGLGQGGVLLVLPRFLYRRALRIIIPAESALRRLIMMAAYALELRGVKCRKVRTTSTNFALLNTLVAGQSHGFNLLDPRKIFGLEAPDYTDFDPCIDDEAPVERELISAVSLARRLLALKMVLETLPKYAKRLARWYEQRDAAYAQNLPHYSSPARPGPPIGYRKHKRNDIEEVLLDCHSLALYARDRRDSS